MGLTRGASAAEPPFPWERLLARRCDRRIGMEEYDMGMGSGPGGQIGFDTAIPSPEFYPWREMAACLRLAWKTGDRELLSYGPREGYWPLREWLAGRLRGQGLDVEAEGLFIVSGSQQGLDLVGKLLLEAGDTVLIGLPTYPNAFRAFQLFEAELAPVPTDGDGLRTEALEALPGSGRAKLLYVMSNFHNPGGACLPPARRREILRWSREAGVPVVEDNVGAGLAYDGEEPLPLRGLEGGEEVILLGTFSKVLFPGLRLGWMVLPPAVRGMVRDLRGCTDLATPVLLQRAMLEFCRRGHLDRHLETLREVNGRRLAAMLESLVRHFPREAQWSRPRGGMTVWVTLPPGARAVEILAESRRAGVSFAPGTLFYPGGGGESALRLSFVREPEERIRSGMATLGKIVKGHLRRLRRRAAEPAAAEVWI